MSDQPDIIKILHEAEKLGELDSTPQGSCSGIAVSESPIHTKVDDNIGPGANNDPRVKQHEESKILQGLSHLIFENSAIAIMLTDDKERIVHWNSYTEKLLGWQKEDLMNKPVKSLYPPEEWLKIRKENIRQKGIQHHLETKMIKKNEEVIDVVISLSILKDPLGNVVGSIGIVKDNSQSKQMERALKLSEEKFKQLYEKAPIPYHILSSTGVITNVSEKWCEILGYSKMEATGRTIFDFISENEKEIEKASFFNKIQSRNWHGGGHERTFITKGGEKKIFVISDFFSLDETGAIKSIHSTMDDVTVRKKMEFELKDLQEKLQTWNKELEQKVHERTVEIEVLLKQKDEFIGQLGHDLKTPISVLLNICPLIKNKIDDPGIKNDFEVATRNVQYIKNLVTETLRFAELSSPKVTFDIQEVNLFDVIQNIVTDNQCLLDMKNIKLDNLIDQKMTVQADQLRLSEILNNLVNNAVRYSGESDNTITFHARQEHDVVTISVSDTGIGMTKEQIARIFDEFYKADYSRHNLESSGLGLSICKRIVQKHGGSIWATSPGLGKGSTFYFTLKTSQKAIESPKETNSEKTKQILILDDNTDLTYVVKKGLEAMHQGCKVLSVNCAQDCFDLLNQGTLPDVILLDIRMPDMNGWDVCAKLKGNKEWQKIPIIFLTARTNAVSKGFATIPAQDYIEKPFEIAELKRRIDKILGM